jgi:hypothetical protein
MTPYVSAAVIAWVAVMSSADTVHADVVTEWNAAALKAIRADRTPPPPASRVLAILHVSMYDAINGIVRTHERYVVSSAVRASASVEAAASASARAVLTQLFPAQATSFDIVHRAILAGIKDGPHKRAGSEWGERVAREIFAWRTNDNADAVVGLPAGGDPRVWRPTPPAFAPYLLPQWGFVTPFAIPTGSFMRPPHSTPPAGLRNTTK